jgi:hypothetical protein
MKVAASTGVGIDDQTLADAMDLFLSTFYTTLIANNARYNGVQVYIINRIGPQPAAVHGSTNAGPGTIGPLAAPKGAAVILAYNTNVRGPSGRGRLFLPFLPTNVFDADGQPLTAAKTFINSFFGAMRSTFIVGTAPDTAQLDWIVYHRRSRSYDFIVGGGVKNTVSNLHKRGDYGRANASPI